MSSAVIIDSGCDLPENYVRKNPIKIMPLNLIINSKEMANTLN
ncbi:DegV family protein [Teredinibacter purpureus]|nr:DegV family protein [Teredinibacter purpureus]